MGPDSSPPVLPQELAIRVRGLGKCYRIYGNPRDRLKQALWRGRRTYFQEFWALRGVGFDVEVGDTVGIIGRNGSGKSTLLQLICGTLTPTEGTVQTQGRVAALLELGSGFNPEFTGLENVYLNASLLGLSRSEVEQRLDGILAFADIGAFVHQPVKTYSSGMTVRLAFAVMAHVDADILIIDEALAVGDAFFTQKCMRFIHRFRERGTLLFVSHDPTAVTSICERALLLEQGRLSRIGPARAVSEHYAAALQAPAAAGAEEPAAPPAPAAQSSAGPDGEAGGGWKDYRAEWLQHSNLANFLEVTQFEQALQRSESFGDGSARIVAVELREAASGRPLRVALGGEAVILRIEALAARDIHPTILGFLLKNDKGLVLLGDNTNNSLESPQQWSVMADQRCWAEFEFILPLLPYGSYSFTVGIAEGTTREHHQLHWLNDALILESTCTSIAAGLAGVVMRSIRYDTSP